jgi:hypothetical protein
MSSNNENEFNIAFGKAAENSEKDDSAQSAPKSKEEMAEMIARNMAQASSENDDIVFGGVQRASAPVRDIEFSSGESRQQTARAEKSAPKKKKKKSAPKKKKKSAGKKAAAAVGVTFTVLLVGCAAFYLAGLNAYKGRFLDNTYINGINVSGLTQADAYEILSADSLIPDTLTIAKRDGSEFSVKLSDIGYTDNTKVLITQYYSQQNHYGWLASKFKNTEFNFTNEFNYDKDKLEEILKRKVVNDSGSAEPQDAYIEKNEDSDGVIGYVIVKEVDGDKIDSDKIDLLYQYAEDSLDDDIFYIDVSEADCYEKAKVTSEDLEETCDSLNNLFTIEISFDFTYTTEELTGDTFMDWIEFDENDPTEGYTVNQEKVEAYVEELGEKYDTYGKDRTFKTTNKGTITIEEGEGCYGWWIDQEKTRDMIIELLEAGDSANTEPIYYVNPYSSYTYTCNKEWRTADSDYGDTYIEVDLTAQHLWYYKDGKVEMESDIVSGYPSESRNTNAGVYKLWYKELGKTLTGSSDGESYSSYVDYWNYISTVGVGLHDASWQNGNFGGERYKSKTWGSHGCINMPFDKAKYVYENIDMGTPVFMYWVD